MSLHLFKDVMRKKLGWLKKDQGCIYVCTFDPTYMHPWSYVCSFDHGVDLHVCNKNTLALAVDIGLMFNVHNKD